MPGLTHGENTLFPRVVFAILTMPVVCTVVFQEFICCRKRRTSDTRSTDARNSRRPWQCTICDMREADLGVCACKGASMRGQRRVNSGECVLGTRADQSTGVKQGKDPFRDTRLPKQQTASDCGLCTFQLLPVSGVRRHRYDYTGFCTTQQ